VPRWLRKAFQRSPCLHTAAAPTLPSSDRDPSVHHIQTPAPTLASLSLAQRIASLFAAVSSLSMTVLTAGSEGTHQLHVLPYCGGDRGGSCDDGGDAITII